MTVDRKQAIKEAGAAFSVVDAEIEILREIDTTTPSEVDVDKLRSQMKVLRFALDKADRACVLLAQSQGK